MTETITNQLETIKEEICDDYCKWPERYRELYEDPDKANERMLTEVCGICPLLKI